MSKNSKSQKPETTTAMSLEDLQKALSDAKAKVDKLSTENAKLRQAKGRRPEDAMLGGVNLVFQKGTHKDLIGKRVRFDIQPEAVLQFTVSGVVKESKSGNAYVWSNIVVDTPKLKLQVAGETKSTKSTRSFAETVGVK